MYAQSSRAIHTVFVGVALALLVACSPAATNPPAATALPAATAVAATARPASAPQAEATQPAVSGDAIKTAIQTTLDRYAQAKNEGDVELLRSTIDPQSGPFRRLVVGRFETAQESALHTAGLDYRFTVDAIAPRDFGFVQAEIESYGYKSVWTFREVDGRWLLSEPSKQQLGEPVTQESDNFTFQTYPWADDVNAEVMKLMEEARTVVKERLGRTPESKAEVTIRPTFGIDPWRSSDQVAYYAGTSGKFGRDYIVIYSPHSFAFGYYMNQGWQPELRQTLIHEYTHLVNDRSFTSLHRIPDWMSEGLAEYVSDSPRADEVAAAIEQDALIPLIDPNPANPAAPQDLQHMGTLERDVSLAYGEGYSLVAYIVETYGGLDGFWKLAEAYDKQQDLPKALQDAFNVSYQQFDRDWRAWLKKNY